MAHDLQPILYANADRGDRMTRRARHICQLAILAWLAAACGVSGVVSADCEPESAPQLSGTWQDLTDSQLRGFIERACGRVFVGLKEAGTTRGVDPQGRSLTTPETVERMKEYLVEHGVTIEWEGFDLPHVSARMPPRLQLVRDVRRHPNVDYLEPIFPGTYLAR